MIKHIKNLLLFIIPRFYTDTCGLIYDDYGELWPYVSIEDWEPKDDQYIECWGKVKTFRFLCFAFVRSDVFDITKEKPKLYH